MDSPTPPRHRVPPPGAPRGNLKRGGLAEDGWVLPAGYEGRVVMPGRVLFLTVSGQVHEVPRAQIAMYSQRRSS